MKDLNLLPPVAPRIPFASSLYKSKGQSSIGYVRGYLHDGEEDIKIAFYGRDQVGSDGKIVPVGFIRHNSHRSSYIYIAFLAALVLATPIPWRRKGWTLLWGKILINGFIGFNLAIWILYGFNKELLCLLVLSPF